MRNPIIHSFDFKLKELTEQIKVQKRNWLQMDRRLEGS